MQLIAFDAKDRAHLDGAAAVWNAACGPDLSVSPAFVAYNARPESGVEVEGRLAVLGGRVLAFAQVSRLAGHPLTAPENQGWLDALVIHPDAQRRGLGTDLLAWAEGWFKKRAIGRALMGGGTRPYSPSLPEELSGSLPFFEQAGWRWENREAWDVARDLGDGRPIVRRPMPASSPGDGIRQAEEEDRPALEEFLARSFAGRWHYSAAGFLREGGRVSDFVILRQAGRVEGFAWLTFPDSARPLERMYPQRLPKPWGHLGPIGVAEHMRGLGWGGLVLQSGLMALRAHGVRGCVIDWTGLLDFYGKWGFKPYRRYLFIRKTLE